MAATILGQAGYLVNVAADAQGGIASAVKAPPRVILTAVTLPAVDGKPWWERLRSIIDGRVIPFVFLTGAPAVATDIRGFAHGVDECLSKPFRVEDLERIVRTVVARAPEMGESGPVTIAGQPAVATHAGPGRPSQWHRPLLALRGVLGEIGLPSLLTMLDMERKSGILVIDGEPGTARFFLRKGRIMRAEVDHPAPLSGALAVYSTLGWDEGHFELLIGDIGGVDEIQASTTFLLMEGARRADESKNNPQGGS